MDLTVAGAFIDDSASEHYSNVRVLGVRLRKFCYWHSLLLNTVDSPFMRKGAVTMLDIRIAVGICRLAPFNSRIRKPWLVPALIYTSLLCASLLRRKHKTAPGTPKPPNALQRALAKRANRFLEYCNDYLQFPEYTIIPPDRGKNYVPQTSRGRFNDVIETVGELITWGIPERQAWEMPIGRANVYRIIARRAAGNDIDITTEAERKFREGVPPEFRVAK